MKLIHLFGLAMESTIETYIKAIYFSKNTLSNFTCKIIILDLIFQIIIILERENSGIKWK